MRLIAKDEKQNTGTQNAWWGVWAPAPGSGRLTGWQKEFNDNSIGLKKENFLERKKAAEECSGAPQWEDWGPLVDLP